MIRRAGVLLAAAALSLLTRCGYTGEPLPPLLRIPARVADLTVMQRTSQLVVRFTLPALTTEGTGIAGIGRVELRVGPGSNPFDEHVWAAGAKVFADLPTGVSSLVRYEIPSEEWTGREIVAGVKVVGENGRDAGWSNFAVLSVIAPLGQPRNLSAEGVPAGVRLVWQGAAPEVRVFRQLEGEQGFSAAATVKASEWVDTAAQYGKQYRYYAMSVSGTAESAPSLQVTITPVDRFPPAVPTGLAAVAGAASIELAWERNAEPDFAGYRVYRGADVLAALHPSPVYSDRKIESGKTYRYSVSAVDKEGNESARSPEVEIAGP